MNDDQASDAAELRRQAEERLRRRTPDGEVLRSTDDTQRLLLELQVHQIELEMQNEQLRESQAQLEAATQRYMELYDFAPVAYFTLDRQGAMTHMNLTAARLLGHERARLQGKRFGAFVAIGHHPTFNSLLERVFADEAKHDCRVELTGSDQPPRTVEIEASRTADGRSARAIVVDITERVRMEQALAQAREATIRFEVDQRFGALAHQDIAGLTETDAAGRFIFANDRFCAMVGRTSEQLLSLRIQDITHPEDRARSDELYQRLLCGGRSYMIDKRYVHSDGRPVWASVAVSVLRAASGEPSSYVSVVLDITERQRQEEDLRQTELALRESEQRFRTLNAELETTVAARTAELALANAELLRISRHDVLTGLHNRLAANERLHGEFVAMKRSGHPYAVVLMDIDLFKSVNDTHGHAVGDQVLQRVAQALEATLRESDFVARYGGEEFLAVLPATGLAAAGLVAEKLRQAVESAPYPIADPITLSLGVALADPAQPDEDTAVREADDRLYEAKRAGRNQWKAAAGGGGGGGAASNR